MKQVVILSGKGGTGKTSVVASLAHLASQECRIVLGDADVDAANLDLVLKPRKIGEHNFSGGKGAVIEPSLCTSCGRCQEVCRFDAIQYDGCYLVDASACEGCAVCHFQCPAGAIRMEDSLDGLWFQSESRFGMLFHAHLYAGRENSGKLVTMVKQQASLWAAEHQADYVILDGPPGIGCPVIAASAGADLALLVVEPTVSGIHDLERILATTDHFGVGAAVVINKCDINPKRTDEIELFCRQRDVPVLGRIPFDTVVTQAMLQGEPVTVVSDGQVTLALQSIWRSARTLLDRD